jgi:membrane-bound lytic murein transglycosylase MltF
MLTLHEDVSVRAGGSVAWAIRENSPQLKSELNEFVKKHGKGTAFGSEIFRRYLKSTKYVKNATNSEEIKKFKELVQFFRKYGDQYGMDWMLMAAQGYQESRLDQNAKSQVGAIGIMQLMPATGREMDVGDIRQAEPNDHAGVKYIRHLVDEYFRDEPMDPLNKWLMAFASYNAGPGRVRQLRQIARSRGLDANVWFGNVERVASERVGRETVQYVSNIFKYYVAYRLVLEQQARADGKK